MFLKSQRLLAMPRYHWVLNEEVRCLSIFPLISHLPIPAQKVWHGLMKTLPFFQEEKQWHSFLYHPDSIKKLIKELKPKAVWLCIEPELGSTAFSEQIYISPSPEAWLISPLIKKEVWQIWQKILTS